MSYEQEFMKEFEAWVNTQIMINDMHTRKAKKSTKKTKTSVPKMP